MLKKSALHDMSSETSICKRFSNLPVCMTDLVENSVSVDYSHLMS